MKDRRYSEGGEVPSLSFSNISADTVTDKLRTKRRTKYLVPMSAKTSGTSRAKQCFVNRAFSEKLQQCMLNYSYTLVTTKVLSGEV